MKAFVVTPYLRPRPGRLSSPPPMTTVVCLRIMTEVAAAEPESPHMPFESVVSTRMRGRLQG